MGNILIDLLVFLGLLFLLVLILSPVIYYFNKDKADGKKTGQASKKKVSK